MKVLCKSNANEIGTKAFIEKRNKAQDEADFIRKMEHPNIVKYVDSFWDDDKLQFCIIMEHA